MSNESDRTHGQYDAEDWARNDPYSRPTTGKDWGEYTSQDWQRGEKATKDQPPPPERKP